MLVGGGLGDQGCKDREAQGGQAFTHAGDEGGVGRGVLRVDELEVHVQPPVPLLLNGLQQAGRQAVLHRPVGEDSVGQLVGEGALLSEGGQVEQGPYPHGLGRVDEGLVVQRDKSALGGDAVGEGGHGGEEGESLAQKGRVDLRVGVAAHREGALLLLLEGEDQLLAGEGGFPALQLGVVPQKLAQGDPAPLGGLGQGLPRLEDQGLLGVLDHQRLPHRQPAGVRGPVI